MEYRPWKGLKHVKQLFHVQHVIGASLRCMQLFCIGPIFNGSFYLNHGFPPLAYCEKKFEVFFLILGFMLWSIPTFVV